MRKTLFKRKFTVLLSVFAVILSFNAAAAGGLALPTGKVILTISGNITKTNKGEVAQFDRAMLESLGLVSFKTKTPWYDAPVTFEGISLDSLMKSIGAHGKKVTALALNDYNTEIPMSDFAEHGAILALKRDGEYMPVRDKGPLFIVYPYDSDEALQTDLYYGRSAWQLAKLIIE
ncbi:MAG: oxidoreductase [Rhizobium sp.]|nr:oxidoreductase [Rhizobium sp.]